MNLVQLRDAITIYEKYVDVPSLLFVEVDGSEIILMPTDKPMSQQDVEKMLSLNWWQNNEDEYQADEPWHHYV